MTPCIHRGCLHTVDRTNVFSVIMTRAAFLSVLIRRGGPTNHITCLSDLIAASDSITLSCMFSFILPERVETQSLAAWLTSPSSALIHFTLYPRRVRRLWRLMHNHRLWHKETELADVPMCERQRWLRSRLSCQWMNHTDLQPVMLTVYPNMGTICYDGQDDRSRVAV